jgi:non-homologous end joining protein Ku
LRRAEIKEKVAGNEVTIRPTAEPEPTKVSDLMAVLKASVESTKGRKSA